MTITKGIPHGMRKGDLIATIDPDTGLANEELIHVLRDGTPATNVRGSEGPEPDGKYWELRVRHLDGTFAGQGNWLLLVPGELVKLGYEEVEGEPAEDEGYPPSVWSRYRTEVFPQLIVLCFVVLAAGGLLGVEWLETAGQLVGVLGLLACGPALFFEFRADRKYDRESPCQGKATPL